MANIDTNQMISEYNLLDEFTKISQNYYNDVDISKLREGIFGYTTESMARSVGNILLDSSFRAKETNIATAQKLETLLLEAGNLDMPEMNNLAIPANIDVFLGIQISDILKHGIKNGLNYTFTIDKDSTINILGYLFMLDYDIVINANYNNSSYVFSSMYIINNNNIISTISNPYIISSTKTINGIDYLFLRVTVKQLEKSYQYYKVLENDLISTVGQEFQYDDKLVYFNAWYKKENDNEYTKLSLLNKLSKSTLTGDYLIYDITENGFIKITPCNNFDLEFNSEIKLDIFTTKGSSGNFTYKSGDTSVNLSSYENTIDYHGINITCIPITDSINGCDQLPLEQLRTKIINTKSTLNGLQDENDLNIYFKSLDTNNNMLFIKKRDDVIERRFIAYMIPRDSDKNLIQTTTMNLNYNESDFDNHYVQTGRYIIYANTKFSLVSGEKYTLQKNSTALSDTEIATAESDPTKLLFGTPFLIIVNTSPQSVSYYLNSINKRCLVKPTFINVNTKNQFIINYFDIVRNAMLGDNGYKITANVIPNGSISDVVDSSGNITNASNIKVYGVVYDSVGEITGYFPLTMKSYDVTNNYFTFEATLTTDDYLATNDSLQIINTLYAPGSTTVSADMLIPGINVKIGLCVYRLESPTNGRNIYDTIIPGMTLYTLSNTYTNENDLADLFVDMTSHIISTVILPTTSTFNISEVPLIRYSVLKENATKIVDILSVVKNNLDTLANLVTNNFTIDLKFYRTYGSSLYYKIGNLAGSTIDKVNLSMQFNIYLYNNSNVVFNSDTVDNIKLYVKKFIENTNFESGEDSLFISNLTTNIEENFGEQIKAIELTGLNSYTDIPREIIYDAPKINTLTQSDLKNYVPEFLNIDLSDITINIVK